ncbi:MAG TPA: aminopeptidase, partial [Bacillota bacterium]|nr:aminopeptidase [Bacillota bacterium]
MIKKSRLMLLALVFIVVFSSVVFAEPYAPGQTGAAFDQKVVARVDGNKLIEHIRVLSEDIGPRVAGTDAEWAAAEYIAD